MEYLHPVSYSRAIHHIMTYTSKGCCNIVLYLSISITLLTAWAFQKCSRPQQLTLCRSLHAKALQAIAGKGLAQGPYMAARAGFEPTTLQSNGVVSTNTPPCPTVYPQLAFIWHSSLKKGLKRLHRPTGKMIKNQSTSQSVSQPTIQWVIDWVSECVSKWVSEWVYSVSQSGRQSINQSINSTCILSSLDTHGITRWQVRSQFVSKIKSSLLTPSLTIHCIKRMLWFLSLEKGWPRKATIHSFRLFL